MTNGEVFQIPKPIAADLVGLDPGEMLVWEDPKTKRQWAIMPMEDFEHLCDLLKLKAQEMD